MFFGLGPGGLCQGLKSLSWDYFGCGSEKRSCVTVSGGSNCALEREARRPVAWGIQCIAVWNRQLRREELHKSSTCWSEVVEPRSKVCRSLWRA